MTHYELSQVFLIEESLRDCSGLHKSLDCCRSNIFILFEVGEQGVDHSPDVLIIELSSIKIFTDCAKCNKGCQFLLRLFRVSLVAKIAD